MSRVEFFFNSLLAHYKFFITVFFTLFYKCLFRATSPTVDQNCENLEPYLTLLCITFASYITIPTSMFAEKINKGLWCPLNLTISPQKGRQSCG